MLESRSWHEDLSVRRTIDSLSRKGFEVIYLGSKEEALLRVLDLVPADAVVGLGGSVTLREMGLPEALRARGNTVADHWEARRRGASGEEVLGVRRQQLNSDVFITSTNAITETGALVNIDGGGQRVAAMIFGPRKVIVVAGVNKITGDVEGGLHRAMNVAAPMNARRLDRRTPCASTGACSDCDSEDRICSVTTIIYRRPRDTDTTIMIVGEKLGY